MTDEPDPGAGRGELVVVQLGSPDDPAAAIARAAPADIVLLAPGARVWGDWLQRMSAAAGADLATATASALGDPAAEPAAELCLADRSPRVRPRVPAPGGPAVLVRRSAIELAGGPVCGAGGAIDPAFARRCVEAGLGHVLADDVLVAAAERWPPEPGPDAPTGAPVRRAVGVRRRATGPLTIAVDARPVAGPLDGTRTHVLELVAALGRAAPGGVTALVGAAAGEARALLDGLPGVSARAIEGPPVVPCDVLHRPFQLSTPADLSTLAPWGQRLVVTHQDLISYDRADYFPAEAEWLGYRAFTRRALAASDRVVFPSDHARDAALREELVEPARATVVRHGVDHRAPPATAAAVSFEGGAADRGDGQPPLIVCVGADYRHKNRPFLLEVVEQLQERHAWPGRLVLCGPRMRWGSSREAERRLLERSPRLAAAVQDRGPVSETEKRALLSGAALVAYPTVAEGFGFIPFEAADNGAPCLWAAGTAIGETIDDAAAPIVAWDAAATADRALELMTEPAARAAQLDVIAAAAARLRWDATAETLLGVYAEVADGAPSPGAEAERSGGLMQGALSEDAVRLVGPGGLLPREVERPLLALATRPRLARAVYAALRTGYRWSRPDGR